VPINPFFNFEAAPPFPFPCVKKTALQPPRGLFTSSRPRGKRVCAELHGFAAGCAQAPLSPPATPAPPCSGGGRGAVGGWEGGPGRGTLLFGGRVPFLFHTPPRFLTAPPDMRATKNTHPPDDHPGHRHAAAARPGARGPAPAASARRPPKLRRHGPPGPLPGPGHGRAVRGRGGLQGAACPGGGGGGPKWWWGGGGGGAAAAAARGRARAAGPASRAAALSAARRRPAATPTPTRPAPVDDGRAPGPPARRGPPAGLAHAARAARRHARRTQGGGWGRPAPALPPGRCRRCRVERRGVGAGRGGPGGAAAATPAARVGAPAARTGVRAAAGQEGQAR